MKNKTVKLFLLSLTSFSLLTGCGQKTDVKQVNFPIQAEIKNTMNEAPQQTSTQEDEMLVQVDKQEQEVIEEEQIIVEEKTDDIETDESFEDNTLYYVATGFHTVINDFTLLTLVPVDAKSYVESNEDETISVTHYEGEMRLITNSDIGNALYDAGDDILIKVKYEKATLENASEYIEMECPSVIDIEDYKNLLIEKDYNYDEVIDEVIKLVDNEEDKDIIENTLRENHKVPLYYLIDYECFDKETKESIGKLDKEEIDDLLNEKKQNFESLIEESEKLDNDIALSKISLNKEFAATKGTYKIDNDTGKDLALKITGYFGAFDEFGTYPEIIYKDIKDEFEFEKDCIIEISEINEDYIKKFVDENKILKVSEIVKSEEPIGTFSKEFFINDTKEKVTITDEELEFTLEPGDIVAFNWMDVGDVFIK